MKYAVAVSVAKGVGVSAAAFVPPLAPPVNVVPPSITGNAVIGATLTCAPGQWTGNPNPTGAYQWKLDNVDVAGATTPQYVTTAAGSVTCAVTGTNSQGSATAVSNAIVIA